jgi:hypothetical protein
MKELVYRNSNKNYNAFCPVLHVPKLVKPRTMIVIDEELHENRTNI